MRGINKKIISSVVFLFILAIFIVACDDNADSNAVNEEPDSANEENEGQEQKDSNKSEEEIEITEVDMREEVTLTLFWGHAISAEELIKDPVEAKFPNVWYVNTKLNSFLKVRMLVFDWTLVI